MAKEAAPVKFADMAAAELRRLIDKTRFAISTEETRYYRTAFICIMPRARKAMCCAPLRRMAIAWRLLKLKPPRARTS